MKDDAAIWPRKQRDVLDAMSRMIESRGLGIGDRLPPEVELARDLGVGRSTVREVLGRWQSVGIVTRNKGAGTILTADASAASVHLPISIKLEAGSLLRMLAVRRPLEIEAARLAARAADAHQRDAISASMLTLIAVHRAGEDWRAADGAFHAAIHDATGNPLFGQIIEQLQRAFAGIYEAPFGMPRLGSDTIPLHRPLAEAVVGGDEGGAVVRMSEILDGVERAVRTAMEEMR